MAQGRKARTTPKGEGARSLEHAKTALRDLRQITDPNETEAFVGRLNDFLRALRAVPEFLGKEPRGSPRRVYDPRLQRRILFMQNWIETYLSKLSPSGRDRYDYLIQLREVSTHHLMVKPDRGTFLFRFSTLGLGWVTVGPTASLFISMTMGL